MPAEPLGVNEMLHRNPSHYECEGPAPVRSPAELSQQSTVFGTQGPEVAERAEFEPTVRAALRMNALHAVIEQKLPKLTTGVREQRFPKPWVGSDLTEMGTLRFPLQAQSGYIERVSAIAAKNANSTRPVPAGS